ncbi:MAG: hypothetical protein J7647_26380 [Cyanobacteria bacterium SBLK]|nr:hypothetical protein [Cyanobacteria bacterium SBLK]
MFKYQQEKQNTQENGKTPDGKQNYRPAVPISVYRELAKELQETKGELETLKQQNHQLTNENKLMRQELDKITQCVQSFQQVKGRDREVNNSQVPLNKPVIPAFPSETQVPLNKPVIPASPPLEPAFEEMDSNEEYAIEVEPPSKNRRFSLLDSSGDISGWLLAIAIALMVLTAFGAGFLFVRPWLLNNNNNN